MATPAVDQARFFRIRPRFELQASTSYEEIADRMRTALAGEDLPCTGRVNDCYLHLYVLPEEHHYWSPQLNVTMENNPKGCRINGYYGPRPAVWTMFAFFYAVLSFATLMCGIIGLSFYQLDMPSGVLWLVPFLVIGVGVLYFIAYRGQQLGHDQIIILHRFFEEATGLETVKA